MDLIDLASWALLTAGAFFCVVGGIGLHRLPDFFSRAHAAGVTDSLGAGLVLGGLMLQAGWSLVLVKLVFVLVLLWVTSPTAAHAIARAAREDGIEPHTGEGGPRTGPGAGSP